MAEADALAVSHVELLAALFLATDLGTGQPAFHGVRTAVLAGALGRELGLDGAAVADVQRVACCGSSDARPTAARPLAATTAPKYYSGSTSSAVAAAPA